MARNDDLRFRAMSPRRAVTWGALFVPVIGVLVSTAWAIFAPYSHRAGHPIEPWLASVIRVVMTILSLAFGTYLIGALIPSLVTIRRDGIEIRWLWRHAFIPFREVGAIREYVDGDEQKRGWAIVRGIELLHSGGRELVGISNRKRRHAFHERALQRWSEIQPELAARPELFRAARTPASWLEALRALGEGTREAHRSVAVDPDRLRRTVGDPSASASDRAAAAVVLALSEVERVELHRMAPEIGDPRVRAAVIAAAEQDDAALESALGAVSEDVDRRARGQ